MYCIIYVFRWVSIREPLRSCKWYKDLREYKESLTKIYYDYMEVLKKELKNPINEINDYLKLIHKRIDINMNFKEFSKLFIDNTIMKEKIEKNEMLYKLAFNEISSSVYK